MSTNNKSNAGYGGVHVPTNGDAVTTSPSVARLNEGTARNQLEEVLDGWVIQDPLSPNQEAASGDEDPPSLQQVAPEDHQDVVASTAAATALCAEVALGNYSCVMGSTEILAVLSAVAPAANGEARAALRLNAVIDKSGSMHGEKLRLVKKTMLYMLRHLSPRDALGLVVYDTNVEVAAPMTLCDTEGRERLEAALKRLNSGSQTNLSGGLLKGLELHEDGIHKSSAPKNLQRFSFGNTYRQLSAEEAEQRESLGRGPAPEGAERIHEWTMEFRFDDPKDADLVKKVVYNLHHTFRQPVVEVVEAPFRLTRHGWGTFVVQADMHLHDGRCIQLDHDLRFGKPESFRTLLKPLQTAEASQGAVVHDDEQGVVRSTFLFTDGLANVGITKAADICAAAEARLGEMGDKRCSLSTFGFGGDHDAGLLQGLAEVGEGIYSYVESEDKIGAAFGEALGGLLSTTHQNVRLSLDLEPGVDFVKALSTFPVQAPTSGPSGTQVAIEVGDLFAEERRDVLVMLTLPKAEHEGTHKLGTLSVRGFSLLEKRTEKTTPIDVGIEREAEANTESCHPQVLRHQCRHVVTEALEAARLAADGGNLARAREIIHEASETVTRSPLTKQGDAACLGFLTDLNELQQSLQYEHIYRHKGSKMMNCMKGAHMKQRACYGQDFSAELYGNAQMKSMKEAFAANSK